MSAENLWGSLEGFKKIRTPMSILREQGQLLFNATKGILNGIVITKTEEENISIAFEIEAPRLNKYRYFLLQVDHNVKIYPLNVFSSLEGKWKECKDEASFLAVLKSILSSPETKKIIESLLSQSES